MGIDGRVKYAATNAGSGRSLMVLWTSTISENVPKLYSILTK
jgi:hypothetical protein